MYLSVHSLLFMLKCNDLKMGVQENGYLWCMMLIEGGG